MKTVVVMPTYNERENISSALEAVLTHPGIHVLVVDDNSPDGTASIVENFMKTSTRVQLLRGAKQGLGVAYRRGFEYALSQMDADILVEMDADGSHDAADIPRLLKPLLQGEADFVIGSRYVSGGAITGWSWYRRALSWGGNTVSRIIAGIPGVHDCTAGFRAMRAEVALRIDWESFVSHGYSFQLRLLYEAIQDGARVTEVPVTFIDREFGDSKLGLSDLIGFAGTAVQLCWRTYKRVALFLLVGLIGLLINEAVFVAVYPELIANFTLSQAAGIAAGIFSNFTLHELWTFRDRLSGTRPGRFGKYLATSLLGVAITFVTGHLLLGVLRAEFAHLVAVCTATVSNVLLSFLWAWKRQ